MSDSELPAIYPASYLSRNDKAVSSFELLKFIECLHLARGRLTGPEASLLHCLIMRGWTTGKFRVPQSILSLQTGLSTKTISRISKVFELEGLIRRNRRRNYTSEYILLECKWTEEARHLFWHDEVREKAIDAYVQHAWRHSKRKPGSVLRQNDDPPLRQSPESAACHGPSDRQDEGWAAPEPWTDADMVALDELLRERTEHRS